MLKRSLSLATAALLAALVPAALRAQTAARPVFDQVTVGGGFGGLSGAADADRAGRASARKRATTSTSSTATASTRRSTTSPGRAASRCPSDAARHWAGAPLGRRPSGDAIPPRVTLCATSH